MLPKDPTQILVRGIRACQQGEWRDGLTLLSWLEHNETYSGELPGMFYSYLGHAVARCEGRKQDGIAMCRHAVEIEPFLPVNYLNLARTHLLARERREALAALRQGLALDPEHRGLLGLHRQLGIRRRRPIAFLARSSWPNRVLGRLRAAHGGQRPKQRRDAPSSAAAPAAASAAPALKT